MRSYGRILVVHLQLEFAQQLLIGMKFRKRAILGIADKGKEKENGHYVPENTHGLILFRIS
jgi:hypothetical protein